MTDAVEIALITTGGTLMLGIAGLVVTVILKLNGVHQDINSRFDEWMDMVKKSSHAEGVQSERDRNAGS